MSKAKELELLNTLAKKDGYPDWKEYMRNHTAVFYPVGVNSLMHSFASLAVTAISLARKESAKEIKELKETIEGMQNEIDELEKNEEFK